MNTPRRRALLCVGGLLLAVPPRAADKPKRVGFLANTPPVAELVAGTSSHPAAKLFKDGLRERGWVDGANVEIVWRSAEGRYEQLGTLAEEMIRLPVDVIVAFGPGVGEAARRTSTIPIVMGAIGSVGEREVGFLSRPGRNVTGMTLQVGPELDGKRLSLLREAAPGAKRVAFLTQAERGARLAAEAHSTAAGLGLELFTVHAKSAGELEAAFEEARNGRADAMLVTDWPAFNNRDVQLAIHSLARRHRLPVMHSVLDAADSGGLMSYAADIRDNYRRVPYFVDRILRGAKPADIPIEQPRRFELVVNLEAARAIGLSLAPSLLAQADRMVPAR